MPKQNFKFSLSIDDFSLREPVIWLHVMHGEFEWRNAYRIKELKKMNISLLAHFRNELKFAKIALRRAHDRS